MSLIFLLFGIVVVIKVISFSSYDKIYDLLWLIVLGSIAVRGLRPSFQKKESENRGIAADIPLIVIFLQPCWPTFVQWHLPSESLYRLFWLFQSDISFGSNGIHQKTENYCWKTVARKITSFSQIKNQFGSILISGLIQYTVSSERYWLFILLSEIP